jgi:hypothetical protein
VQAGELLPAREGDVVVEQEEYEPLYYWYGPHFLLSGVRKIKNKTEAQRRQVFFLQKIQYGLSNNTVKKKE